MTDISGQITPAGSITGTITPSEISGVLTFAAQIDGAITDGATITGIIENNQIVGVLTSGSAIAGQVLSAAPITGSVAAGGIGNVTNGDAHDHAGGDGAQIDHGGLLGLSDDDHTQYVRHNLSTAANDFLVGSGVNTWIKKTLAETITILRTSLDGAYAALTHTHVEADITDLDHTDVNAVHASAFTQDSGVLVGTGAGTYQEETGATLRTSLGLSIGTDVLAPNGNGSSLTGITASQVAITDAGGYYTGSDVEAALQEIGAGGIGGGGQYRSLVWEASSGGGWEFVTDPDSPNEPVWSLEDLE